LRSPSPAAPQVLLRRKPEDSAYFRELFQHWTLGWKQNEDENGLFPAVSGRRPPFYGDRREAEAPSSGRAHGGSRSSDLKKGTGESPDRSLRKTI
jgi:hypothetical protein